MVGEPTTILSNGGDEVITEPGSRISTRATARPAALGALVVGRIAVFVRPSTPKRLRQTSGDADLVEVPGFGMREVRLEFTNPVLVQEGRGRRHRE